MACNIGCTIRTNGNWLDCPALENYTIGQSQQADECYLHMHLQITGERLINMSKDFSPDIVYRLGEDVVHLDNILTALDIVVNDTDIDKRIHELQRMPYKDYLETPEWRATRQRAIMSNGHICQVCGTKTRSLVVHHRSYEHRGDEYEISDLVVLCRPCHELFHKSGRISDEAT